MKQQKGKNIQKNDKIVFIEAATKRWWTNVKKWHQQKDITCTASNSKRFHSIYLFILISIDSNRAWTPTKFWQIGFFSNLFLLLLFDCLLEFTCVCVCMCACATLRISSLFNPLSFFLYFSHSFCLSQSVQIDINDLNLPKTCTTEFPDPDDLLTFKLIICPDEGFYKGGRFRFSFKVSKRSHFATQYAWWTYFFIIHSQLNQRQRQKKTHRCFFMKKKECLKCHCLQQLWWNCVN